MSNPFSPFFTDATRQISQQQLMAMLMRIEQRLAAIEKRLEQIQAQQNSKPQETK